MMEIRLEFLKTFFCDYIVHNVNRYIIFLEKISLPLEI